VTAAERIAELHAARPRSPLVRATALILAGLALYAWLSGEIAVAELWSGRRWDNLRRFLERDATPYPLRADGFSWSGLWEWARPVLVERGLPGAFATLWISVLAIVLAGGLASLAAPLGARTLMAREPYLAGAGGGASRPLFWRAVSGSTRAFLVLLRAIPEYLWAFLLLAMFGASAWPAVLALAIHNAGILGRLGADTIENLDRAPLRALRALGASRRRLVGFAVFPLALGRFLLYFFYRFETCVREATVLGMLGVVSLGYWIQDARARNLYDDMLLLVALGAVLVLLGDLASYAARSWVKKAS